MTAPPSAPVPPLARAAALLALLLFATASLFPAIGTCARAGASAVPDPHQINWFGNWVPLTMGWMAALVGQIGWYANIPFAINAVMLLMRHMPVRGLVIAEGLLAMASFAPIPLPHNEAWSEPVCAYGTGFWVWLGAHALVIAAAWAVRRTAR